MVFDGPSMAKLHTIEVVQSKDKPLTFIVMGTNLLQLFIVTLTLFIF